MLAYACADGGHGGEAFEGEGVRCNVSVRCVCRDVMEVYKERAMKLFSSLMDDVRRNTVYSLFIYKPATQP